jgi:hypothetical protein
METNATKEVSSSFNLMLWAGLLAGPIAFLLQLQINYALIPWVCATGHRFVLHLVSVAAFLSVLIGSLIAWLAWRRMAGEMPDESAGAHSRSRFMAVLGLLTGTLFLLLIIAQEIPNFVLNPCEP